MSTISTIKMTARQFLELGEDPPGIRLELVDGEVAVSPSPNLNHSYTDSMLRHLLLKHIQANDLGQLYGDVDTVFGSFDVRRPDILYFAKARVHLIGSAVVENPPDLCVEIVSTSSMSIDRRAKFKQYEKGKVGHYWIIDPAEKTVEAFKLVRGKYRLSGKGKSKEVVSLPPFKGLEIPLAELWRPGT